MSTADVMTQERATRGGAGSKRNASAFLDAFLQGLGGPAMLGTTPELRRFSVAKDGRLSLRDLAPAPRNQRPNALGVALNEAIAKFMLDKGLYAEVVTSRRLDRDGKMREELGLSVRRRARDGEGR